MRVAGAGRAIVALLWLAVAGCGGAEVPEATTSTPTAEPRVAETVAERTLLGRRIGVTLLGDEDGTALAAAWAEAERVAGLAQGSPELGQLTTTTAHVAERLGVDPRGGFEDELRLAYAIDRIADALTSGGVGDFLVFGGTTSRARGSSDGGHGGGWRLGLAGAEADRSDATLRLRGQATHTARVEAGWANGLGGSAVLATAAAELAARAEGPPAELAGRATAAGIGLRAGRGEQVASSGPWEAARDR